jgi:hypothetical protein
MRRDASMAKRDYTPMKDALPAEYSARDVYLHLVSTGVAADVAFAKLCSPELEDQQAASDRSSCQLGV